MDRKIEPKKGLKKKHLPYVLGGAFVLLLLAWIVFGDHSKKLNIDKTSITVSPVAQGEFKDYVRVTGQVQPKTVVQLSPLEGGVVQEKVVEEGTLVKKGDVIIRLSNTSLNLEILNSEASLAEKENFLRNTRVTMEQEKLSLQQEMAQLLMNEERSKRKMNQYETLHTKKLVSTEEYLQAKEDYSLAKKRRELVAERQIQDSIYRSLQVLNLEASLRSMKQNMALTYQRLENLNVKSPISGQLGAIDVVLGQSISSGTKIGQVNDLSAYKIVADIDEHYIDRINAGLLGTFDRQGTNFSVEVRKVYPEVNAGKFKTDFVFAGENPDNIRAGQTYYINLEMGLPEEAIYIPRGSFYQTTGGNWIFVVSADGSSAERRKIKIGKQNPQFYQVLEGLNPGEKVIVSSYENFGENEKLIIK